MKKLVLSVLAIVVAAAIVGIVRMIWFSPHEPEHPAHAKTKVEDINVRQKGKSMQDVTGADLSPGTNDMELGKVHIEQEADSMRNVTGVRMHADNSSGTVELKDEMTVKRKTPKSEGSVRFNPDAGEIKFFGKEKE